LLPATGLNRCSVIDRFRRAKLHHFHVRLNAQGMPVRLFSSSPVRRSVRRGNGKQRLDPLAHYSNPGLNLPSRKPVPFAWLLTIPGKILPGLAGSGLRLDWRMSASVRP
jgi:hypothetical protein